MTSHGDGGNVTLKASVVLESDLSPGNSTTDDDNKSSKEKRDTSDAIASRIDSKKGTKRKHSRRNSVLIRDTSTLFLMSSMGFHDSPVADDDGNAPNNFVTHLQNTLYLGIENDLDDHTDFKRQRRIKAAEANVARH